MKKSITSRFISLLPLLLIFVVVGCGFHLKRPIEWPSAYQNVAIRDGANEGSSALAANLRNRLIQQKRNVVESGDADLVVTIVSQDYRTREIASSFDGRNREYVLTLTAVVSVENRKGEFLLTNAEFSSSREQQIDETNVLGNSDNSLRRDLENQVVDGIMRRIQATIK